MQLAEHETTISFDYEQEEITIYTTRRGEKNGISRRLPENVVRVTATVNDGREVAWTICLPMKYARKAYFITVGPDKGKRLLDEEANFSSEAS